MLRRQLEPRQRTIRHRLRSCSSGAARAWRHPPNLDQAASQGRPAAGESTYLEDRSQPERPARGRRAVQQARDRLRAPARVLARPMVHLRPNPLGQPRYRRNQRTAVPLPAERRLRQEDRPGVDRVPWNPDESKLRRVVHALRAVAFIDSTVQPPSWLDGRDEPVIACRNGLLRIADRTLIRHTNEYFNLFSLPFDYDATATCPRWKRFLEEILPGTPRPNRPCRSGRLRAIRTHRPAQLLLALIGATRSGKGTIDTVLTTLIGTQCARRHVRPQPAK